MAKILKVIIEDIEWNDFTKKWDKVQKVLSREEEKGNFDYRLCAHIDSNAVSEYAGMNLNMVDESEAYQSCRIESHQDYEIMRYMEDRGFQVIKCQTLSEKIQLEEIIQNYGLTTAEV